MSYLLPMISLDYSYSCHDSFDQLKTRPLSCLEHIWRYQLSELITISLLNVLHQKDFLATCLHAHRSSVLYTACTVMLWVCRQVGRCALSCCVGGQICIVMLCGRADMHCHVVGRKANIKTFKQGYTPKSCFYKTPRFSAVRLHSNIVVTVPER